MAVTNGNGVNIKETAVSQALEPTKTPGTLPVPALAPVTLPASALAPAPAPEPATVPTSASALAAPSSELAPAFDPKNVIGVAMHTLLLDADSIGQAIAAEVCAAEQVGTSNIDALMAALSSSVLSRISAW